MKILIPPEILSFGKHEQNFIPSYGQNILLLNLLNIDSRLTVEHWRGVQTGDLKTNR